ncbi:hypothetical protein L226DRAFT_210586 [Lentinus tigrinus ALCF2SS1-7]|uniref:uncharacterized protein n=1 Tax=Lentinus tigrinus ALCF2SS1-7 TaxID=1328758 RepID=UPI001166151C|nr:hypothetical protein L226DRAFT_210586 [Lentinus tigrinus ALCF2SS1-7]
MSWEDRFGSNGLEELLLSAWLFIAFIHVCGITSFCSSPRLATLINRCCTLSTMSQRARAGLVLWRPEPRTRCALGNVLDLLASCIARSLVRPSSSTHRQRTRKLTHFRGPPLRKVEPGGHCTATGCRVPRARHMHALRL